MINAARPSLSAPDDDPYLWLEDIDADRATQWADVQTAKTVSALDTANFRSDCATLAKLLDRPGKLLSLIRRGDKIFNFWTDHQNPRGLWRHTTLHSLRSGSPTWATLLDLDALAKTEAEDWVWQGASTLPGPHDRAILRLSRGGSDAVVLREFDIPSQSFAEGGFSLSQAKGGIDWWDRDTLILSSAFGGDVTTSGYARTVRLWRRGTDPSTAPVIFETDATSMSAWASVDRTVTPPRVVFMEKPGFFDSRVWLGDLTGPKTRLELPLDATTDLHGDVLLVKIRTSWTPAAETYAGDTLLAVSLSAFLAGHRRFTTLFEPGPRRVLQSFAWAKDRLILGILDELQPRFEAHTSTPTGWVKSEFSGVSKTGMVNVGPLDLETAESNGDLLVTSEDPLTPPTQSLIEFGLAPIVLNRVTPAFDPANLVITQHEAVSNDGERIPYTQVGPKNLTGSAPVHMVGYGGFQVTQRPYYATAIGKLWLERGGTHVITNIRGGGEFGTRWHDAGRREKKRLSHDDFAAIAADLVHRGVSVPSRIAAEGGSNGGILISNMLTRYPERFGALFCTIPLIDMRRYAKLLAGASWIAEYGDPDVAADWAYLQHYSAYHNLDAGKPYPPILIATTRKDDRVHPGHARKFAAKLQALGHAQTAYFELATGGHGYGKDNAERAMFITLGLTFLAQKIGWSWSDG